MAVRLHPLVAAMVGPQVRQLISHGARWCSVCGMRCVEHEPFLVVPWRGRMDVVCVPCAAEFEHVTGSGVVCPTCFSSYSYDFGYVCPYCLVDSWPADRVTLALAPAEGVA